MGKKRRDGGRAAKSGNAEARNSDGGGSATGSAVGIKRYDDSTYVGDLKNGKPHGKGRVEWDNGEFYEGEWRDGWEHGRGITGNRRLGDVVYVGELKDGEPHGKGREEWVDGLGLGNIYEGEFRDGHKHGCGIFTSADGGVYDGEWRAEMRHGRGVCSTADGGIYDGEWKDDKMHGRGTYTWPSGKVYEGHWEEDMQHGNGTLKYSSGTTCVVKMVEGLTHGKGTIKFYSGDIYEGVWRNNIKESKGKMTWASGDVQTGHFEWSDGRKLRSQRSQQQRLEKHVKVKACEHCGVDDQNYKLRACSGCGLGLYCSLSCQRSARGSHRRICGIVSLLPPRDGDRLILEYDEDKMVDLDAGLRYATKHMDTLKHLGIDLREMRQDSSVKLSAKQLSSLLRSKKGKVDSFFWMDGLYSRGKFPDINESGNAVLKELHGLKQLRLDRMIFDDMRTLHDIIDQQRDTLEVLEVLCLPKAKPRRSMAHCIGSCENLVKLKLLACSLMDSDLKIMLRDLPNLRILRLPHNGSHDFTDKTCGLIARECPGLQELDLDHHNQLSVRGIRKIFEGCVHLRSFCTTTHKLSREDVQNLLKMAPQLLHLSLDDEIDISAGDLAETIEATGGRTVFAFGSWDRFYEPEGELISSKTREKYEHQKDALVNMWCCSLGDPEVANVWADLLEG